MGESATSATAFQIYMSIPFTLLNSVPLISVIVGYSLLFSSGFCAEEGAAADLLL